MEKTKFQKNSLVKSLKRNILNFKTFNKILFVSAIALGIFYIAGANDLAIKGFALSDLKKQQSKIADENKKLELRVMALSSYSAISAKVGNLKMVAVGATDYINGNNGTVAKK